MTPETHAAFHRWLDNFAWHGQTWEEADEISSMMEQGFAAGAEHGAEQERIYLIALLMEQHWGTVGELAGCSRVIRLIEARMQEATGAAQARGKEKP